LIALKQKGASEQILDALVWAEPFGADLKEQLQQERAAPGLPWSSGVYYRDPTGWISVPSSVVWPPFYSFSAGFSRTREFEAPIGGRHADLQVASTKVGFYLRSPSSLDWRIVHLRTGSDRRWLQVVSTGHPAVTVIEADTTHQVHITRVATDIYTVKPVAQLPPGEYALCAVVPGAANVYSCHGFGVH
jgi:hypothetical protein